jgi:hypothetical protein
MADELAINVAEISAEIDKLSGDDLKKELLGIRVRQKVQQKKNYNPEKMKTYQQKQREKQKLMKERALRAPATDPKYGNLWEEINAQAEAQAEAKINEEAAASVASEDAAKEASA